MKLYLKQTQPLFQRCLTLVSLVIGILGGVLIWSHRKHSERLFIPGTQKMSMGTRMRERSEGFRDLSERNFIGGERRFKDIVPFAEPIFIANLTSRVGGYIVSVRRVNSYGCPFDANPAAASENESPNR